MKNLLKKYIRPTLKAIGVYSFAYKLYFSLLSTVSLTVNHFYKLFFRTAPILLYHRITTTDADPVKLCVTPECFESHLQFLKKNYDVIPLSELSRRLITGKLKGNEASITLDDGYRDNLTNALPLLEKYNVPATIFVTTGFLGEKASFEWDMKYKDEDRATFLSENEIQILAKHPLIEIGAHTHKHSRLSNLSEHEQKTEIIESKTILERITGRNITSFAFPFGGIYDFDNVSKKIVKELGFDFSYSNINFLSRGTNDPYSLPRINIRESTVTKLSKLLMTKHWSFIKKAK